jgi:hypothetical protein
MAKHTSRWSVALSCTKSNMTSYRCSPITSKTIYHTKQTLRVKVPHDLLFYFTNLVSPTIVLYKTSIYTGTALAFNHSHRCVLAPSPLPLHSPADWCPARSPTPLRSLAQLQWLRSPSICRLPLKARLCSMSLSCWGMGSMMTTGTSTKPSMAACRQTKAPPHSSCAQATCYGHRCPGHSTTLTGASTQPCMTTWRINRLLRPLCWSPCRLNIDSIIIWVLDVQFSLSYTTLYYLLTWTTMSRLIFALLGVRHKLFLFDVGIRVGKANLK